MFEPQSNPRVFALPCGVDFPAAVVAGLKARLAGQPPEAMARVELYVNTARMRRRIDALFAADGASFLPRTRLITELGSAADVDLPTPVNPLRRRLELAQLVRRLIETEQAFDAPSHAFDLADSLAQLMEEMQVEGVHPDVLRTLNVGDHSAYWQRSQTFLTLVTRYFAADAAPDSAARQRAVVRRLIARWQAAPPEHPVIIAGSTGSRGTTRLLMEAVARLPQGALILPGFDDVMPKAAWAQLDDAMTGEDHPQFRFRALLQALAIDAEALPSWSDTPPPSAARNALVSLALRPAPVTDAWLTEGPELEDLAQATADLTLIEAPTARDEALSIALRLRKAAQDGTPAALITPDRMLTRQVTAALHRWGIAPDDSAGVPLPQTPPGRILRQTAELLGQTLPSDTLLALLKHPLVCQSERGAHLKRTRDLELKLLRGGPPFPTRQHILDWAAKREADIGAQAWVTWLWDILDALAQLTAADLTDLLAAHIALTERLCAGPVEGAGALWLKAAGEKALEAVTDLREVADGGGTLTPGAYSDLVTFLLNRHEVRDPDASPHPGIMIWGTLEARVQGADLVILAGLNDGIWPELPKPDPWLNRPMRKDAGLLLPERRIGLSAHDFQQAIAAPEVWLTRARRDAEAETVQSRWMNRLTNLMGGLEAGQAALKGMSDRGAQWLAMAAALDQPDQPTPPARRPSPRPPVDQRPKLLPVTQIEKLIRDPYAVYARYVLNLRALDPLHASADAPLRGRALHDALEQFVKDTATHLPADAADRLAQTADAIFAEMVPWPATRALWQAKLARATPWFLDSEAQRRQIALPRLFEVKGAADLPGLGFTLEGRADRIDLTSEGQAVIYDYKTGVLPTKKVRTHFDKQLFLLAAIAQKGGFATLDTTSVLKAAYIGLGSDPKEDGEQFASGDLDRIWDQLALLVGSYMQASKGFTARRAVHETRWEQDYDHLARYGEWDETDPATPTEVGHET